MDMLRNKLLDLCRENAHLRDRIKELEREKEERSEKENKPKD